MSERSPGYDPRVDSFRWSRDVDGSQDEDMPLDLSIRSSNTDNSDTTPDQVRVRSLMESRDGKRWVNIDGNRKYTSSHTVKESMTTSESLSSVPGTSHICGQTTEAYRPLTSTIQTQSQGVQTEGSSHQVTSHTITGMSGGLAVDSTVIGTQEVHNHQEDGRFKNICQSSMQMINRDDSDMYVSTYAERSALKNLKQFGSIFIKGRSGSGKSRLGLRLLAVMRSEAELRQQKQLHRQARAQPQRQIQTQAETEMQTQIGRTAVVLTSPAQWELIPKNQGKYTVLIDDIFGSSNIVQSQVDDWMKCFEIMCSFVESGHIFLVITSRPEISAHCESRLKRFSMLKNELRIDEGVYQLRYREKMRMLRKICNDVTFDKKELYEISRMKTKLGFPQCCKYFACSQIAQDKGLAFFQKPHAYILDDVKRIQECDGVGYLALVLVLMRNGCLPMKDLIQSPSDFLDKCQPYCRNLPQRITLADVKQKLESLCGVYLRKEENAYEFQHQSIYDAVFISISHESPAIFVRHCPVRMLLEFVRTTRADEDTSDAVVCIEREYYVELADRITQLLLSREYVSNVVNHPCLKEDSFIHFLVERWIEMGYLSHILNTKLDPYRMSFDFFYKNKNLRHQLNERTLLSFMVMKNLHTLVQLLLKECDAEIKMDILPFAILMGNNDLVNSVMESGILPNTVCFTALRFSGDINNDLTERIFNHIVRRVPQPATSLTCPAGDKTCQRYQERILSVALHRSLSGENSRLVELLVDEIAQQEENSKHVFKECLIQLFEDISGPYSVRGDITRNTVKIARKLLGTGCEVDADYLTWVAAGHPDAQLLKIMLQMDVDISKRHKRKGGYFPFSCPIMGPVTSLEYAVYCGGYNCVKTLLNYIAIHDEESKTRLQTKKINVSTAFKNNASKHDTVGVADTAGKDGSQFLHWAAQRGDDKKLTILIDANFSVNTQGSEGNTPLHEAVKSNSSECVKILLTSHASVDIVNGEGRIPLQCIEYRQHTHVDIVRQLVQAGSKVNHIDKNRSTVLSLAIVNNDIESVRVLVENGADVNYNALESGEERSVISRCGNTSISTTPPVSTPSQCLHYKSFGTALHLACQHSDVEIVQLLCEHRARVDVRNIKGETVLHIAAASHIDSMEKFQYITSYLDANNDLLYKESWVTGRTALFPATISGNEEVVEFLLNEGLDVNHIDKTGCNVLIYACSKDSFLRKEIVKILLQKGADRYVQDKQGCTSLHYAATSGTIDNMKLLLENDTYVCVKDKEGMTPLHYATRNNSATCLKLLQLLLEKGADPCVEDMGNRTPLHYAAERGNGENVKLLLEKGADPCVEDKGNRTPLHYAAERGNGENVELLLEKGADPCVHDKWGRTPIHNASMTGKSDIIKLLLQTGADVCVKDNNNKTALHFAAKTSKKDCVKLLLEAGADSCVKDKEGKIPLHYAAWTGSSVCLELLLENLANHDVQDLDGKTPIHIAAETGSTGSIKLLLVKGASPCIQDKEGKTALHYAAQSGNTDDITLLLEKGADPCIQDKEGKTSLHYAAQSGNTDDITLLLEKGADSCIQDKEGKTSLHYAAQSGNTDDITLLLEKGADPCIQDKEGKISLHYAAQSGNTDDITLLLEKGADPCSQDKEGKTSLHYAVHSGYSENITLLLKNGANPHIQDKEQRTPLHYAAGSGNNDDITILLETGADQLVEDIDGRTALHYAVLSRSSESIELLLKTAEIPLKKDKEGKTSLHYAAGSGNIDNMTQLLEKGADQHVKDKEGKTALHYAAGSGNTANITKLLEKGADPHVKDNEGRTALHYAVWKGSIESIKLLLKKVEILCVQDGEGKTALHYAAGSGNTGIITLLLEKGSDPHIQDHEGRTALHYAVWSGSSEGIELLLKTAEVPLQKDKEGKTALHYAAGSGNTANITKLLEKGADQHVKDNKGRTALHYAVWRGSSESIKLLLKKVEIPFVQDREGKTALHYAAGSGNADNITQLLEKLGNPNVQDNEGKTALHYAVLRGSTDSIQLLLNKGADPCMSDREDKTALHYATVEGNRDIINLLFEKETNPCVQHT